MLLTLFVKVSSLRCLTRLMHTLLHCHTWCMHRHTIPYLRIVGKLRNYFRKTVTYHRHYRRYTVQNVPTVITSATILKYGTVVVHEACLRSQVSASMVMYTLIRPSTHTCFARSDTGASSEPMRTTFGLYVLPCVKHSAQVLNDR